MLFWIENFAPKEGVPGHFSYPIRTLRLAPLWGICIFLVVKGLSKIRIAERGNYKIQGKRLHYLNNARRTIDFAQIQRGEIHQFMSFNILVLRLTNDEPRILGLPPDLDIAKLKSELDHRKVKLEISESEYRWPDPPAIEQLSRILSEQDRAAKLIQKARRDRNIRPPNPIFLLRSIAAITGLVGIMLSLGFPFRASYREWDRQSIYLREMNTTVKAAEQGAGKNWPQIKEIYYRPLRKQLQIADSAHARMMNRAYAVAISTYVTMLAGIAILFYTILRWDDCPP
jgi:hypothetical protein